MKSNHTTYNFESSRGRIDNILKTSDKSYEELKSIPSREKLTFNNGFYVKCTALFVDIRGSSKLSEKYQRPTLARIYRSYISEVVAVMNGNINCAEVSIEGDCVWGIFDTPKKKNIDSVFTTAATISSIIKTLNCKYSQKNIDPIIVGIGLDYGRALMIKAGYNGSGLNEVVWMGEVVSSAYRLCSYGNKDYLNDEIMVSKVFYNNLNKHNQSLLNWNNPYDCHQGNVIVKYMEQWVESNCG